MKRTFTYKRIGALEIKADVFRPDDRTIRPVILWIHGGALIVGNRQGIDRRIRQQFLEAGYVLVSIDYRLAPETKLPTILEDVEDAIKWVRQEGPQLFQGDKEKLGVLGGSAGGYLTLATGHRVSPRPTVLVAFYGYGDLIGDWYGTPSPHPRHHTSKLNESQAREQVAGPAVADAKDRAGDGMAFYQFCRQTGRWPEEVSGWDPRTDADRFSPYMPALNVDASYPPTLLIHGTKDTDVPYAQSVLMADQLKKHGVAHELITIEGAEHGLAGGDPDQVTTAYQRVFEFVDQRLRGDQLN